jgi:hypothetical protein
MQTDLEVAPFFSFEQDFIEDGIRCIPGHEQINFLRAMKEFNLDTNEHPQKPMS